MNTWLPLIPDWCNLAHACICLFCIFRVTVSKKRDAVDERAGNPGASTLCYQWCETFYRNFEWTVVYTVNEVNVLRFNFYPICPTYLYEIYSKIERNFVICNIVDQRFNAFLKLMKSFQMLFLNNGRFELDLSLSRKICSFIFRWF